MRKKIPSEIEAEVMFCSDRKCCVCTEPGVHIHHIDGNNSNSDFRNLALLCFHCHDEATKTGSLSRKLSAQTILKYRDYWYEAVRNERANHINSDKSINEHTKENFENHLEIITTYLRDNHWTKISFEKLEQNVHPKLTQAYVLKIIEAFPSKIRKCIVRSKPGIKLLDKKIEYLLQENFDNINNWMLYWKEQIKNPDKVLKIENSLMIFEGTRNEIESEGGFFGAFIDLHHFIKSGAVYTIKSKVRSSNDSTMGFQLWVHDCQSGSTSIYQPSVMKTPSTRFETISMDFTATESQALRVHLLCKAGTGQIQVSEVTVSPKQSR